MPGRTTTTVIALESFVGRIDKGDVVVRKGDKLPTNHPAVKKWPQLFSRDDEPPVEQATAAPGERR